MVGGRLDLVLFRLRRAQSLQPALFFRAPGRSFRLQLLAWHYTLVVHQHETAGCLMDIALENRHLIAFQARIFMDPESGSRGMMMH